jgi:hypothetical protein
MTSNLFVVAGTHVLTCQIDTIADRDNVQVGWLVEAVIAADLVGRGVIEWRVCDKGASVLNALQAASWRRRRVIYWTSDIREEKVGIPGCRIIGDTLAITGTCVLVAEIETVTNGKDIRASRGTFIKTELTTGFICNTVVSGLVCHYGTR